MTTIKISNEDTVDPDELMIKTVSTVQVVSIAKVAHSIRTTDNHALKTVSGDYIATIEEV